MLNRMHWGERAKWKEEWGYAIFWAIKGKYPKVKPSNFFVTVQINIRRVKVMDKDNLYTSVKAIVDGLKGLAIKDDHPSYCNIEVNQQEVHTRNDEGVSIKIFQSNDSDTQKTAR